jgi:hypothetical protein
MILLETCAGKEAQKKEGTKPAAAVLMVEWKL